MCILSQWENDLCHKCTFYSSVFFLGVIMNSVVLDKRPQPFKVSCYDRTWPCHFASWDFTLLIYKMKGCILSFLRTTKASLSFFANDNLEMSGDLMCALCCTHRCLENHRTFGSSFSWWLPELQNVLLKLYRTWDAPVGSPRCGQKPGCGLPTSFLRKQQHTTMGRREVKGAETVSHGKATKH